MSSLRDRVLRAPRRMAVQLYTLRVVSIAAVALLALASIHFAEETRRAADYVFRSGVATLRSGFELEMMFEKNRRLVESAPADLDRARLQANRAVLRRLNADMAKFLDRSGLWDTMQGSGQHAALRHDFTLLAEAGDRVMYLAENFSQDQALEVSRGAYAKAAEAIDLRLDAWRDDRLATADRELASMSQAATRLGIWVGAGGLLAVLLIGPIGILIKFRILRRLGRLTSVMLRLSRSETALTVPYTRSSDEIGDLARALEVFKNNAIELQAAHLHLDTALNNMSQGLCMYDAQERLLLWNERVLELYAVPPCLIRAGLAVREVLGISRRGLVGAELDQAYQQFRSGIPRHGTHQYRRTLPDGRSISVSQRAMPDGGWVETHEDVTEQIKAEKRIAHMALYDGLTNLPNRFKFHHELQGCVARAERVKSALLCLDLDGFKNVNDAFGHAEGDALLRQVAARLTACIGKNDIVSRLGGDEFAILLPDVAEIGTVTILAGDIIRSLSQPYDVNGHQAIVGASVGIVLIPDHGNDADQLLKHADLAMYGAKAGGRGSFRLFEPAMDERIQARHSLEIDLRRAVDQNQFELHFQPTLWVKSGEVSGFEALLRWRHPTRGMVSPCEFIPVAEEVGLINRLGKWVLRQACMEASAWPEHVHVAVNLSAAQFRDADLVQDVFCAIGEAGLDPRRLELEITETVLLQDDLAIHETLHQIRGFGVKIAMDDFGTGYSSLSYLRSFPFDKIKIDQGFIRGLDSGDDALPIVHAVIGLASGLRMTTTAEGVETRAQLEVLQNEGCDEAQGYLFSPAVPGSEVLALLDRIDREFHRAA
ncbi:bifunctional diguanylate cyclase/phosphodiesterase [Bradyrhizobium sp. WD16]|uniref:putative bifunctional diguanylate cyclase/phosphodiesterase n=1 Tax=Bradyrhizobium sp. WD16 TaxID=1521768 RepID=UPI0020A577B0|nr:EAL domain-containing protein [Bradyrhizobium sp. WD16]UTD27644.1 hypothetical protein DB459_12700 [Bradyrhizobium sp. WD16]